MEYGLWLGLFLSALSSATILPGTSEASLIFALHQYPHKWPWALLIATFGNSMGSMISYGMGRMLPERLLPSVKVRNMAQQWGLWSLLFTWLPIVGDALAIAAGYLRFPLYRSALLIFIGKLARYSIILWGVWQLLLR